MRADREFYEHVYPAQQMAGRYNISLYYASYCAKKQENEIQFQISCSYYLRSDEMFHEMMK